MQDLLNQCDVIWINANLATMASSVQPYGFKPDHALGILAGRIHALLPMEQFDGSGFAGDLCDAKGRLITPGLIDSHTHLIFAGSRAHEFEKRLTGISYEQIAREGGGIHATVRATRQASEQELFDLAEPRLQELMRQGVTTVEIKSGYGLSEPDELKMLRVAKRLSESFPVRVCATLLAAHVVPKEYSSNPQHYVDWICDELIPQVAEQELASAVDVFCESIAFSLEQTRQLFHAAREQGLSVKGHMDQLSNMGGSTLAAEFGALSVDHLEYLGIEEISALKGSGVVATLLPLASYYLRVKQYPPIAVLRQAGVPMAVATDFNPGSAPLLNIRLAMNMACLLYGLTPEEALAGTTRCAAQALGLSDEIGTLQIGQRADLAIWDCEHPAELSYQVGQEQLYHRLIAGEIADV